MKIFFTTTPRFKEESSSTIEAIYKAIEKLGHTVVYDYLRSVDLDDFYQTNNKNAPVYYEEILDAIHKSDVIVFETTIPSIGVGLLIKEALAQGKGVVILHAKGEFPFFLGGIKDERFVINEYSSTDIDSMKKILSESFDYITGKMDVRFNFFISPTIGVYLDWVSKHKRIPRAVYLRRLIENDMKENKEFEESN